MSMASRKVKRPQSARRNIKQENFSQYVSRSRLRTIQSLLSESADVQGLDAILCVLGIDSRYSEGSRELADYLLFSFLELRSAELEKARIPAEVIDDIIILIRKDRVDVYCNPVIYVFLQLYICSWAHLHLHCMQDEQYHDNEDDAEDFKIHSFIAMADGCRKIGIPFSSSNHDRVFDPMEIEKWPIIQAYAVEGFGGGGFFTLKHEAKDVSKDLYRLYQNIDPVTLETLVTEQLPLFERQWNTMMGAVDTIRTSNEKNLKEDIVEEPIRSYYRHGRIGTAKTEHGKYPFVLFGTNTSKDSLKKAKNSPSECYKTLAACGCVPDQPATHMVCQAVSPKTPLSCCRTYFFDCHTMPYTDNSSVTDASSTDIGILSEVYIACISATLHAIETYSSTLDISKAQKEALSYLLDKLKHHSKHVSRENVEVTIDAVDSHNRSVKTEDVGGVSLAKCACVTVYNIPSVQHKGKVLGSVAFSETFLNSSVTLVNSGTNGSELNSEKIILTSHVPRLATWPVNETTGRIWSDIRHVLEKGKSETDSISSLGQCLVNGHAAHLACPTAQAHTTITDGHVYLYENGVAFVNEHLQPVVIPKSFLETIHVFDGDSSSVVVVLVLSYKDTLESFLPSHLHNQHQCLAVGFLPKTKAHQALYHQVLPVWKQNDQTPPLEVLSTLPKFLQPLHSQLQDIYRVANPPPGKTLGPLSCAGARLANLSKFMDHIRMSSVGEQHIPQTDWSHITGHHLDQGSFTDGDEITVTILGGVPGSHKETLCHTLTQMAKQDSRWAVLRQPLDSLEGFHTESLQRSLGAAYQAYSKRRASSSKKMRALIVTPGFTDLVSVIQAVVRHPNAAIRSHLKIGAVTVCVDPHNTYMTDRYLLPNLLDQCAEGWVNNIVFTDTQDNSLTELQTLVRSVNTNVALLLAEKGLVTRSPDLDLILSETAFDDALLTKARYLSCPSWSVGGYHVGSAVPNMNEVLLRFSQPLDKAKFNSRLKGLKSSHKKYPFQENIYHVRGKVMFLDSTQQYEVQYTVLSGNVSTKEAELQPMPPSSMTNGSCPDPYFLVFTGASIQTDWLKDWLRGCARQKPQKKAQRTKESLTKDELKKLHTAHHLEALPEGWFYNGSRFVSLLGDKTTTHPNMDSFIEEYLAEINKKVDAFNQQIHDKDYPDMFS